MSKSFSKNKVKGKFNTLQQFKVMNTNENACLIQNMCISIFLCFPIFSWSNSDSSLFYLIDFLLISVLLNITINWYVSTTWKSVGFLYDKNKPCRLYEFFKNSLRLEVQVVKYAFATALWDLKFSNCVVAQFTYVYTYLLISNIWNHYY